MCRQSPCLLKMQEHKWDEESRLGKSLIQKKKNSLLSSSCYNSLSFVLKKLLLYHSTLPLSNFPSSSGFIFTKNYLHLCRWSDSKLSLVLAFLLSHTFNVQSARPVVSTFKHTLSPPLLPPWSESPWHLFSSLNYFGNCLVVFLLLCFSPTYNKQRDSWNV